MIELVTATIYDRAVGVERLLDTAVVVVAILLLRKSPQMKKNLD